MHFPSRPILKFRPSVATSETIHRKIWRRRRIFYQWKCLRTTQRTDFSSMQAPAVSSKRKTVVDKSQRPAKLQKSWYCGYQGRRPDRSSRLFQHTDVAGSRLGSARWTQRFPKVFQFIRHQAAHWLYKHSLPFSSFDVSKDSLVQEFLGLSPSSKTHFTNQDAFDIHYTLKNDPVGDPRKRIIQMMQILWTHYSKRRKSYS